MKRGARFGDFNSIAGGAYSGAADVGVGFAYFKGVIAVIVAVVLIIFGFVQSGVPDVYTEKVKFKVETVTQIQIGNNSDNTPIYNYTLTGKVDKCNNDVITVNSYPYNVNKGQLLTDIYMRPNCVGPDGVQTPISNKTMSRWMLGIGFAIIIFTVINIYFVRKFKGVAAVQGVGNIMGLFRTR